MGEIKFKRFRNEGYGYEIKNENDTTVLIVKFDLQMKRYIKALVIVQEPEEKKDGFHYTSKRTIFEQPEKISNGRLKIVYKGILETPFRLLITTSKNTIGDVGELKRGIPRNHYYENNIVCLRKKVTINDIPVKNYWIPIRKYTVFK